jgi:nitrous oxidase accessory protein NosD
MNRGLVLGWLVAGLVVGLYLLSTSLFTASSTTASGNTLEICAQGCPYATVEEALSAASAGDTLLLHPGIYPTAATISIPALTLRGQEQEAVVLTAREPYEAVLRVLAPGITIENLTFQGNPNPEKLREQEFNLVALQVLSPEGRNIPVVLRDTLFRDWRVSIEVRGTGAKLFAQNIQDVESDARPSGNSIYMGNGAIVQVFDSILESVRVENSDLSEDRDPIEFEDHGRGYLELRGNRLWGIDVKEGIALVVGNTVNGLVWKEILGYPWTYIVLNYGTTAVFLDNVIELGEKVEPSQRGNGIEVWYFSMLEARGNRIQGYKEGISIPWQGGRIYLHDNELIDNEVGVFVGIQAASTLLEMHRNRIEGSGQCGVKISPQEPERSPQVLTLRGEENLFLNNAQDLCPEDYPWPENFKKSP